MDITMRIGQLIEQSGLKKNYIAKQMGVQPNTITRWANGGRIYLDDAIKLAKLLGCTVEDLYEE
ncbi:helix-turn-helix domain-containing protein [Halobacillus salinus]|uniref:helix-turn-helix domain-containing protein n=1 Tax=Halobacillus salinus TaxID=192814 RepID=UPI0009A8526B|nr:helix-turn-helix transcriptional regulator [Halobacillus salinus]